MRVQIAAVDHKAQSQAVIAMEIIIIPIIFMVDMDTVAGELGVHLALQH
jgi:hypothetical protein